MFDNKVITSKTVTPQLTNEDWKYVTRRGIHLTPYTEIQEAPRIHVGCDHLWELVDGKKCKLPSGLHIIATKFGNMISGKKATSPDYQETQVALNQEETDIWDRYWSIDSSGTHEYTGPEKTEKQHLDEEVMKTFKETIVRKPEGYYVRLPWKTKHETLPENKSMALARLRSLLRQHKDRLDDLKEIDRIFKEQLQQGIIELVPGNMQRSRKNKVHYLAYQVVNTPEKKTTPKRIVFDASAHPAGKPSLNDVLYQGPLILPNILGMLMRFRMGQIATIADIEKAFLQVRLHEDDRDATRFMWVRDVTCPLQEDNILTYRFTQVTFGLNASSFLLAATISFHLDTANHSPEFAAEIKNNLYVDNLLMTAETKEEPLQQYHQTKEIFDSLKMNMREFLTNDEVLMNSFRGADKSTTTVAKVLGLEWAATTDTFKIKCNIQPDEKITKRMILHANASIYDPLGWMSPLLIRNKSFFQSLWKNNYEWDDILDEDDQEQWRELRNSTAGFTKEIPCKVAHKQEKQTLFVFSDARVLAMAACVYIKNNESQHLLVAKTKLPSIKGVHTIPKIEINALTIATRLALTTYEELKRTVEVQKTYLFSDSEIALSWLKNASETKPTGVLVTNKVNEMNRIAEKLTKEGVKIFIGYVNTKQNPADCATRGLTSEELRTHFWWTGPDFLSSTPEYWPEETRLFQVPLPETEVLQISPATDTIPLVDCSRFSSLTSLTRTMAIVVRFLQRISKRLRPELAEKIGHATSANHGTNHHGAITAEELRNAARIIVKAHQKQYQAVIDSIQQRKLNIKQDQFGV
ncbi:hypothetical protein Aduo_005924 [Ancylostoma duodenale]